VVVVWVAVGFEDGVQDQVVLPSEARFSRLQGDLAAAAACNLGADEAAAEEADRPSNAT